MSFAEDNFLRGLIVPALVFVGGAACSESMIAPTEVGGGTSSGGVGSGGQPPSGGLAMGGLATGGLGSGGLGSGGLRAGGGGTGGMLPGATWATTEERIGYSCGNSICHGGSEMLCLAKDSDRTGGEGSRCLPGTSLFQTLLDTNVAACGGHPLLSPGEPESSALLLLMTRKCGDLVMPANCPPPEQGYPTCWPEDAVADLTAWIQGGALRDE